MIKIKIGLLTCALCLSPLAAAFKFQGNVYGSVGNSDLSGFVQVPQGGSNGSTSFERPTLNELRIVNNHFYTLGTVLQFAQYDVFFNYTRYAPHGNALLKETLLTHGKVIPAGAILSTFLKYDYFVFGAGYRFLFEDWTLVPFLQTNFMKFHYEYDSSPILGARTFNVTGVNLGLKIGYQFTPFLSGDLRVAPPLPVCNFTQSDIEVGVNKSIPIAPHFNLLPRIAVGMQQFDYEDNQGVPNHIRIRNAPFGKASLALTFD